MSNCMSALSATYVDAHVSVPAPIPALAPWSAAVVPMSATGSFDGSGVSVAGRPATDLTADVTGLSPRAAPV